MSEPATPARPFYVTGGTLKPGEPSYVERRADTELFESLLAGEFCYVLTARQMGKSSLMARTAKRLEQAGVASAIVDLTQIGSERGDQAAAQWYFGVASQVHRQLGIATALRSWWQERAGLSAIQRLADFFREVVLANVPERVVVFVDEIDSTIGLPFADDFFAALRACFNARATDGAFERLTFVLLGVATPDQLIQDPARTPFNIGKRIDLTDFQSDEAQVLAPGLHFDPVEAGRRLKRVLHWTGGHPYLTQALCRVVRERADVGSAEEVVDSQVQELFLSSRARREESNLKHMRARLEKRGPEGRRLLQVYRRVRQGKSVQDQPTSPLFAQLKLTGVVKTTDEGRLAVRNGIYEKVFTPEWAKAAMPADRGRQLAAATLVAAVAGVMAWYALFQPRPYEEALQAAIKDGGYNGALEAYTALRRNPFSRSQATELMQQFWEQRALRYALAGKRDESLLCYLKGLELKEDERLRRHVGNLVGADYTKLQLTIRHKAEVSAVAFSPDSRILATGAADDAWLWNAHSGVPIAPPLRHQGSVLAMDFSPDGQILATGTANKSEVPGGGAWLWDIRTGKLAMPPLPHDASVSALDLSPDGRTIATGSSAFGFLEGGTVKLWDARTGKLIGRPLRHYDGVNAVSFSPDSRTLATGSGNIIALSDSAQLWDVRTGKLLGHMSLLKRERVNAVAFSPDGRKVATGAGGGLFSIEGTAQLWDASTRRPIASAMWHRGAVITAAFSPDGTALVTGSTNNTAQYWDAHSGIPIPITLQHEGNVSSLAFSPDGQTIATGSADTTTRIWEAGRGQRSAPSAYNLKDRALATALSPDGRIVAVLSNDGAVQLLNARAGKIVAPLLQIRGPGRATVPMAFSPDGQTIATGFQDDTVRLWDARSGKLLMRLAHRVIPKQMIFSSDGRTIATWSNDGAAQLWDVRSGELLIPPLHPDSGVAGVAFSGDGKTLMVGSGGRMLRFFDVRSSRRRSLALQLAPEMSLGPVLALNVDGRIIATAVDNEVQLWDADTGSPLTPPLEHQDRIDTISFIPDGKGVFVATGRWLSVYSWDGKNAVLQSSQLLSGMWNGVFRFPSDCERCLHAVLRDTDSSFHLETLQLDGPADPPIAGDPKELLEKWQARLGLKFDEQMKPVPR